MHQNRDYPKEGLYPEKDPVEVSAGLIWFGLGSPKASRRWMAAHSLRTAIRLERKDVLDAVICRFDEKDAGSFSAKELPFFYLHAQLWLLIAMARIALDAPAVIARHSRWLLRIALGRDGPHVLRQHFAKEALVACERAGTLSLKRAELKALKNVNCSLFAPITSRDYPKSSFAESRPAEAPVPVKELHLEYDFDKYDVSNLSRLFGQPKWRTRDGINCWVRAHDAQITHMYDLAGRVPNHRQGRGQITDEYHVYGEQLCWHGLLAVAGQYLAAHPIVQTPYDEGRPFDEWLHRRTLTREDGLWLADGTDWRPLETRINLREIGPEGVGLTTDLGKLRAILGIGEALGDWLVVDGDWSSVDGVEVHVKSALVSAKAADKVAAHLAKLEPFQAFLPYVESDEESEVRHGSSDEPYRPWIDQPHESSGIDGADPIGVTGAAHRPRLSRDAIRFGQLTPSDPFGRTWVDASGVSVVQAQVWCQVADRRDAGRSAGTRLLCSANFVRQYLAAKQADLLLLVILRQTDSGSSSRPPRYRHTTAVVRVTANGPIYTYPGVGNKLHKPTY